MLRFPACWLLGGRSGCRCQHQSRFREQPQGGDEGRVYDVFLLLLFWYFFSGLTLIGLLGTIVTFYFCLGFLSKSK